MATKIIGANKRGIPGGFAAGSRHSNKDRGLDVREAAKKWLDAHGATAPSFTTEQLFASRKARMEAVKPN